MISLCAIVIVLAICSVSGLILPITKSDGSLDVSSLLSHMALMEQSIETKASAAELAQLKSDLAASQKELTETKTELSTKLAAANDELKKMNRDLKIAQTEIVVLKTLLFTKENTSSSQMSADVIKDVNQLKSEVIQLQSLENKTGGVIINRWGRTSCPNTSKLVYKGYTGGNLHSNKASSSSILCLPDQPIYANHTSGNDWYSAIYGTEYENGFDGAPFRNILDEDMPCVVCESNSKTSVMMIPARTQCYPGWTLEYSGYLIGPSANYASGEYICVDVHAEAIPGGQSFVFS